MIEKMNTNFLTPQELAERYRVAKSTVLQWFHQGKIPAEVNVGKVIRFDAEKVAKALEERKESTGSEKMLLVL